MFRVKGNKEGKPLDYKDKYFNTRMAIIFYSIYKGRNSISIQKHMKFTFFPLKKESLFWILKKMKMMKMWKVKEKMIMRILMNY